MWCGFIIILISCIGYCASTAIPSVKTQDGQINGETVTVNFRGKASFVDRYLGIPYAKPPVGNLRFKKSEPFGTFSEPLNAVKAPPACPQYDFLLGKNDEERSEDCLFLNVYVPKQEPDQASGHAVMFFIHGGGFSIGSNNIYRGEVLSSYGNVIVITINYRLGLLGFLDLDNEDAPGNYGFWDQHTALKWVNRNIGAFGGDKDRVTIFGESAGSMSVSVQSIFPANEGLFQGVIAESGALTIPATFNQNTIAAAKFYAENMSCNVETKSEIFNCLKSASAETIIKVFTDIMLTGGMAASIKVSVTPTIDGTILRAHASELFQLAKTEKVEEIEFFRKIKFLAGVNGAEGAMFVMMQGTPEELETFEVTRDQMNNMHVPGAVAMFYGTAEVIPEAVSKMIISEYTDWTNPNDPKVIRNELCRMYGDGFFNAPTIEMSQVHANGSDSIGYVYVFDARIEKRLLPTPSWIDKANHGDEMSPVFGYNFDYEYLANLTNYEPPEWELDLSERIMTYWTNFAKSGNPNKPISSKVQWPEYTLDEQKCITFDRDDFVAQYPFARATDFWRSLIPAVFEAAKHEQTVTSQFSSGKEDTCEKDGKCDGE